jgi:hypothetical protein
MSDKKKARVRALSTKLGVSYQTADNLLKKGRPEASTGAYKVLRAFNAVRPAPDSEGHFQVRPFEGLLRRPSVERDPISTFSGTIEDGSYVVRVFGARVVLPTTEVGQDRTGPYAIVVGGEYPLVEGVGLFLDGIRDEDGFLDCELDVRPKHPFGVEAKGPWPYTSSFGVSFGAGGQLTGAGGAGGVEGVFKNATN